MKPSEEGWLCDGIPFNVFKDQIDQTVPIYQYHYIQEDGWRFLFSFSKKPEDGGWINDGIAFYAYKGDVE